ncbi:MAG: cytochrome c oxidase cbb3-type subunit 3 [Myxococcota bacterium]|jgi:cytochrome c oxidase cbb3-type subunit 3
MSLRVGLVVALLVGCTDETESGVQSVADTASPGDTVVADTSAAEPDASESSIDTAADAHDPNDAGEPDTSEGPTVVGLAAAEAAYATYCALCHGPIGEGYVADGATALNNQQWLTTASDGFIRDAILKGRPGTPMSAWAAERGGPLSNVEVDALVKLIRGWQTEVNVTLPTEDATGVPGRAEPLYEFHCAECHGTAGTGQPYLALDNPELLASGSDAFFRYAIAKGRAGTPMLGYETTLTTQGIDDLVALMRSWQVDPAAPPTVLPNADALAVLNPDGGEPDLGAERHVPADTVKTAIDAGDTLVLLDARPGSDYVVEHISGAISVPFYAVSEHLHRLPTDVWIVAYCACPHAESGLAADALEAAGYTKVRVIDEGFLVWKDRDYPTTAGADP